MKSKFLIPLLLALAAICAGCEKQENGTDAASAAAFDPSKPVEITGFTPKTGGPGERLIIYGSNFGNDTSIVKVLIDGAKARIVAVQGDILYCIITGEITAGQIVMQISIGEGDPVTAEVDVPEDEGFLIEPRTVVSTLFGYRNENESQDKGVFGKYPDARTFDAASWLRFDPLHPHILYMGYDGAALTYINLQDSTYNLIRRKDNGFARLRSIDFTRDGEHMIIANDQGDNDAAAAILTRTASGLFAEGSNLQVLTRNGACNTASVHPVNGELYFNKFWDGELFRYDLEHSTFFGGTKGDRDYEKLFNIQDREWEFRIQIHPTGNYAYIVVVNRHYILRTDYNWDTKRFLTPYLVCGQPYTGGWLDGVGTFARLGQPYQGVFVKNPEYAGQADEYDFYFTEIDNHDIRKMTPQYRVTTFAGRGSPDISENPWGYVDGEVRKYARFDRPTGIAYDEATETFYVGDWKNYRIRVIQTLDTQ